LHRGELAVGPAVILMSSTPRVYNQDHRKLRRQKRYRKKPMPKHREQRGTKWAYPHYSHFQGARYAWTKVYSF
jgi:hypothetical protein